MTYQEKFVDLYLKYINRTGSKEFLLWLKWKTDFFEAPASTRHHLVYPGGLVEHSVNVCEELQRAVGDKPSAESVAICGLLHDVCKADYYAGKEGAYTVKNRLPMGHGEKSVFLIQRHMKLTDQEALAIRWHMGAWDEAVRGGSQDLNKAMELYKLVYELHAADMRATRILEAGR